MNLMQRDGPYQRMKGCGMRTWGAATLLTITAGCATAPDEGTVILDALCAPMTGLAGAVVDDGGAKSMSAARKVIAIYDVWRLDRAPNRC